MNIWNSAPCASFDVEDIPKRTSQDRVTNAFGKRLLQLCRETGLRVINGRHGDDCNIGIFTCFDNNGSSVVDYVLTYASNHHNIKHFSVEDVTEYSKHSPIVFKILTNHVNITYDKSECKKVLKWDLERRDDYKMLY